MPEREERPYWVDCVHGKHECYRYDNPAVARAVVGGHEVEIKVPDYLADVKVFVTAEADGMLFCFGRTNEKHAGRYCGLVMIAKRIDDTHYEVGVWHELYPWALKHFGFDEEYGPDKEAKLVARKKK